MPNNLNSTGLSVGSLGGVIKEVVDPTGRGFLTLQSDTISKTISGWTQEWNDNGAYNIILPSINVGASSIVGYSASSYRNVSLTVKLPSSGNYTYTKVDGTDYLDIVPKTLTMAITTATKAAGGTQIVDLSSSGISARCQAVILYYRYK